MHTLDHGARRRAADASDHFDGRRFFNPGISTDRTFAEFLRWRRASRNAWPKRLANRRYDPPASARPGEVVATFIGQATFLLQFHGLNILTDPVFSERASPVRWAGPRRVRDPGVALQDLPPIHLVLLSHNHYDHMDLRSLRALRRRWNPLMLTGLGNGRYLARRGLGRAQELDWWDSVAPRPDVTVTFVPAQHWSKRGLFDRRRTLWGGFVIEAAGARVSGARVYFAGDTGYPARFRAIRERLGAPDLALLPIGAYEPRWFMAAQHMDPDEAVRAHLDLGARLSIGMHFGTFPLTDEPIDAPARALAEARARHGVAREAFRLLDFGESLRWTATARPQSAAGCGTA